MTYWRPYPSALRFVLAILPLFCIGAAVWLWGLLSGRAAHQRFDTGVFMLGLVIALLLVLAGMLLFMAWGVFSMSYRVSSSQLIIRSGGVRYIVPLDCVTAVHKPGELFDGKVASVKPDGLAGFAPLPGYYIGGGQSPQFGRLVEVATQAASRQVFVVTPGITFGLSPEDPSGFVKKVAREDELEPLSRAAFVQTQLSGPSGWGAHLWADRPARTLLLAGLILNALIFLYISFVYGDLPQLLPLHWSAQAQVDRIGDPSELLRLPAFALAVWLINAVAGWWVLRRERAATLFLLAGAVAAQIVFAAGAVSIVSRAL